MFLFCVLYTRLCTNVTTALFTQAIITRRLKHVESRIPVCAEQAELWVLLLWGFSIQVYIHLFLQVIETLLIPENLDNVWTGDPEVDRYHGWELLARVISK